MDPLLHLDTPIMIGWSIGGGVHRKSSSRKVTSPILALGGLTLKFSCDLG